MNYIGKSLKYHKYGKQECIGLVVNSKEIDRFLKEKHERKTPAYHPWKQRRAEAQSEVIGGKK